jgi:uncharacterized membrane protein
MKTKRTSKTPRSYQLTRISALAALSVVGSFIKLPSLVPQNSLALDSAPGFFAALMYGPFDGAVVCGLGHVATAIYSGFPFGLLHIPIALGLALAGGATGWVNRKFGLFPGVGIGAFINIALVVVAVPVLGWQGTLAFLPALAFATIVNAVIASSAYLSLKDRIPI